MGRALELEDLYRLALVSDPNLSPDGRQVAYVVTKADEASDSNQASIWVVATEGGSDPRRLTNGPGDASPRWTPAGTALLFLVHVPWFHRRALEDEAQLKSLFGPEYEAYAARVKRWIPGVV